MNTINVKDLMSISGKGGLFRFIAQARNGVVVESLHDKKRHVAPATARVSALEDIAIFTTGEDVAIADVFMKIYEKQEGATTIDSKSTNDQLKSYFAEVLPDYDDERVYVSDIKKVITWYNLLHELGLLEIVEADESESESESEETAEDSSEKVTGDPSNSEEK